MTEWKEYKLGEICDVRDGTHDSPKESSDGYPLVTSKNIKDGKIDLTNTYLISKKDYDFVNQRSRVDQWDILFSMIGTIGECAIVKEKPTYAIKNVGLFKTRGNERLAHWIYYYFHSQQAQNEMNACIKGSTQQYISLTDLRNFPISIPSQEEQSSIVSVLSSLDDKIDLLHRENATLEQMAETLFKELVKDKDNDGTLEQIIFVQNGYAFKSKDFNETGEHKVIKIKNISGSVVDIDTTDYVDNSVIMDVSSKFKINSGDVLIAMTGAEIGKLGIIPHTDKSLWLNQRVGLLSEKFNGSKYLAYLQLKSDYGQDYIENTATGSAQPNISGRGIEKCGFPILKQEYILQISNQVGEIYNKIVFNLGQINLLKVTRDFLLPKLMNNEIRF